jgi:DNA-binding MarR family transcriptional regulator
VTTSSGTLQAESAEAASAQSVSVSGCRHSAHFATDADGRLYDRRFRERVRGMARIDAEALLDTEALRALAVAGKVMHQRLEDTLAAQSMTHQQFRALMCAYYSGAEGTHLHAIADFLDVTPRNVTGLVDGLEAQGLIERVADPSDRRATLARLTARGMERATAAARLHRRNQKQVMAAFSGDEKATMRHLALKLLRAAEQSNPHTRSKNLG